MRLKDDPLQSQKNIAKKLSEKGLFRNQLFKMETELQNPDENSSLLCSQEFVLYF